MVKHTQTIRRQLADKLGVFDHFVGLLLKELNYVRRSTLESDDIVKPIYFESYLRQSIQE